MNSITVRVVARGEVADRARGLLGDVLGPFVDVQGPDQRGDGTSFADGVLVGGVVGGEGPQRAGDILYGSRGGGLEQDLGEERDEAVLADGVAP